MKVRNLITLILILYLNPIQAQDWNDEKLEARELVAAKLASDSNRLDRSYGYYQQVRDHYFYGSQGIEAQSQQFFQAALSWINHWSNILAMIDLSSSDSLDRILAKSQEAIEQQAKKLDELHSKGKDIALRGSKALKLLEQAKILNQSTLPQHKELVGAALNKIAELQATIKDTSKLAEKKLAELDRIQQLSLDASIARLKAELLKSGRYPLEQSLARFQEMIAVQTVAAVIIARLEAYENELDKLVINMAYFQAQDAFQNVQENCELAKKRLASFNSAFANHALNRISQLCSSSNSHWQSITSLGLSKAELVYEYSSFLGTSLSRECKKARPLINCEKLAVLKAVPFSQIKQMSDERLRFYEMEWANLEKSLAQ